MKNSFVRAGFFALASTLYSVAAFPDGLTITEVECTSHPGTCLVHWVKDSGRGNGYFNEGKPELEKLMHEKGAADFGALKGIKFDAPGGNINAGFDRLIGLPPAPPLPKNTQSDIDKEIAEISGQSGSPQAADTVFKEITSSLKLGQCPNLDKYSKDDLNSAMSPLFLKRENILPPVVLEHAPKEMLKQMLESTMNTGELLPARVQELESATQPEFSVKAVDWNLGAAAPAIGVGAGPTFFLMRDSKPRLTFQISYNGVGCTTCEDKYCAIEVHSKDDKKSSELYARCTVAESKKDYATSLKSCSEAAELDYAPAEFDVGWHYDKGLGVARNPATAVPWYRKAADHNYAPAEAALGWDYLVGSGTPQDRTESFKWYQKAGAQGYPMGQNQLGWAYLNGRGVAPDWHEAMRWYEKSALQGDALGESQLAWFYAHQPNPDFAKAMEWYRKAADKGKGDAMSAIGNLYFAGSGVPRDTAEAKKWYQKSADVGDSTGEMYLGFYYEEVDHNEVEALRWYLKSADAGNATALKQIGYFYEKGLGVPQDYSHALNWYRKSAAVGSNAKAFFHIGSLYDRGQGVPHDENQAKRYMEHASQMGDKDAAEWLKTH